MMIAPPAAAPERVWKKRPLQLHEVPLPPGGGFTHALLDPALKKTQLIDHLAHVEEVLRETAKINARAKDDSEYADKVLAICERDPEWWIEHFIWVVEPRKHEERPLIPYDFQRLKMIRPYIKHRDTEAPARSTQMKAKSRDMGATWVELACRAHSYMFKDNWTILLGGVRQKDVDDGATTDSLMGKLRFMFKSLPKWMRNRLLGEKWEDKKYSKKLMLINPMKPMNSIEGVQVGDMFGRGGRKSEAFVDEFAYSPNVKNAERSIKQTTTRFCGISTPRGRGDLFEQLMFTQEMAVVQFWIWWPEHPEKDLLWYNIERENMEDIDVSSELDISFDYSAGDRVLPDVSLGTFFISRKNGTSADIEEPDGLWEADHPIRIVIDFGASHPMAAIWHQWFEKAYPPFGTFLDFVQTQGKSVDWIVPFIIGEIPPGTWRGDPWPHRYTPEEMKMIRRHDRWGQRIEVYGDWQGSTPNIVTGAHTAFRELGEYGIEVTPVKVLDDYQSIIAARELMKHMRADKRLLTQRNDDPKWCPTFSEVISQWKFATPQPGMTSKSLIPVHNKFCHGGDCIKMAALTIDIPDSDVAQSVVAGKVIGKRGSDLVRNRQRRRA